ncbi:hypothetical protein BMS3Abin01_01090 [bacterium BMS3Abin01]|nr:hypothetical protein BMS3Abin01_01090 [bacterium BMS3Abin01]HDZ59927.1 hypothetical protein [Actinomycetota bacterium]
MAKGRKRRRKPTGKTGVPRNPFAGRPQSGTGPHEDSKYGKQDRRRAKKETEEETGGRES